MHARGKICGVFVMALYRISVNNIKLYCIIIEKYRLLFEVLDGVHKSIRGYLFYLSAVALVLMTGMRNAVIIFCSW
ncbi:hypothetical protein PSCICJ_30750 [Pseudomonas cichorii]|nr:hypothetical protein PSCICJ_30750 [Pseudomonas cichorii]